MKKKAWTDPQDQPPNMLAAIGVVLACGVLAFSVAFAVGSCHCGGVEPERVDVGGMLVGGPPE